METNMSIIEAVNKLLQEREQHADAITAINDQLKEIAGILPRRKRVTGAPAKVKAGRKAKVNANQVEG